MKPWLIISLVSIVLTGCGHVYIVQKATVEGIHAGVARSPEKHIVRRIVVTGWVIDGFEISKIYSNPEREGPSIHIRNGLPWDDGDPFRHQYPYTYRQAKVRIEGTLIYIPVAGSSDFHPPEPHLEMIDNVVKVLSPIDEIKLKEKNETEPNK